MPRDTLGELELLVLLAILRLAPEAHPVAIVDEIAVRTGRRVHRATVYVTLQRLEAKGMVSSWLGDPLPERGGKPRRYVRAERAGLAAVRQARLVLERMWSGLDSATEPGR
jgi:DNA-binding PadR family transcriptional regulator